MFTILLWFDVQFFYILGFTYCKSVKVAKNVKLPMNATGCECKGICNDPTTCACALRNGSDFPYVSRDGGRLETQLVKCILNFICFNI